jgi:RimJ/RimL family protein N-acetyltransferase
MPYLVTPVVPAGRMRDREQPVLRGPGGLVLRPWEAGDAPVVFEAYQDPAIQQWNLRTFASLAEAGAWIAQWEGQWLAERDGCWAVTGGGAVLGRAALRGVRLMDGVAECTYWVLPAARGRGVATGATVAMARWALHDLGLHRLELRHATANPASCRVAARPGSGSRAPCAAPCSIPTAGTTCTCTPGSRATPKPALGPRRPSPRPSRRRDDPRGRPGSPGASSARPAASPARAWPWRWRPRGPRS